MCSVSDMPSRRTVSIGAVTLSLGLAALPLFSAARPAPPIDVRQAAPVAQRIALHLGRTERGAVQVYFDRGGAPSDALAFFVREPNGWSKAQYLYRREGDQLVLWLNQPDHDRLDDDVRIVLIERGVQAFAVTPRKDSILFRLVVDDGETEVAVERVVPLTRPRPPKA